MENQSFKKIILFDGVCNFCNYNVNLLLKLDKKNVFHFASLQSEYGKNIINSLELLKTPIPMKPSLLGRVWVGLLKINLGFLEVQNCNLKEIDSIILVSENKVFVYAKAIKLITKELPMPYYFIYLFFSIVPLFITNFLYKTIAKYRYKWFGKSDVCRIPTDLEKEKFIS